MSFKNTRQILPSHAFRVISSSYFPRIHGNRPSKNHYYSRTTYRQKSNLEASGTRRTQDSYDFSAQDGWNDFYLNGVSDQGQENEEMNSLEFVYEWHSSVSNDDIISEIEKLHPVHNRSYLFIGCGNSALPRKLYEKSEGRSNITCLDYSQPCLDILMHLHASDCPKMKYVCGDATSLSQQFQNEGDCFNCIVDKGLIDAFMCSENWPVKVKALLEELPNVLDMKQGGTYILVSYKLATSTKDFLVDASLGFLNWTFDIEGISNDRVSFSIATIVA